MFDEMPRPTHPAHLVTMGRADNGIQGIPARRRAEDDCVITWFCISGPGCLSHRTASSRAVPTGHHLLPLDIVDLFIPAKVPNSSELEYKQMMRGLDGEIILEECHVARIHI
ncbi:hypothetical protein ACP70R_020473 [Stipagrostis hirtigluma subsp. patula]